jgi:hypothetical protein
MACARRSWGNLPRGIRERSARIHRIDVGRTKRNEATSFEAASSQEARELPKELTGLLTAHQPVNVFGKAQVARLSEKNTE